MSNTVTLGLVQTRASDDTRENLDNVIKNMRECASRGAQIIAMSELLLSKYFCQGKDKKYFNLAEEIPGPATDAFGVAAKETKTTLVTSIFEKAPGNTFYNSTVILGPDGKIIGKYRKTHIPRLPLGLYDEDFYFSPGPIDFPAFQTPHAKISAPVCYDQWFPEVARISAANGAQIIFYPTAIGWPMQDRLELNEAEHEAWQIIQRSHGIANNVFIAAVNRVGVEGNLNFWGTSFVSDPYGRILAKASSDKEENLVVECDLGVIEEMRKEWQFLNERQVKCEKSL